MTRPIEMSPERHPSSFGIEFRNPDATYALLKHGVNKQKVWLKNNWEIDIHDNEQDLISLFVTYAISPLRVNDHPDWPDRNTKDLGLRQLVRLATDTFDVNYWKNNVDKLKDTLIEQGLRSYIATHDYAHSDDPDIKYSAGPECLVIEKGKYSLLITFLKKESDAPNGEILFDLLEIENGQAYNPILGDYSQFLEATSAFLETSEQAIRAMYKTAGKQLPNATLTYWPVPPNQKETRFIAMTCGSCRGGYPEGQIVETQSGLLLGDPTCPKCGATNPQIIDIPHPGNSL